MYIEMLEKKGLPVKQLLCEFFAGTSKKFYSGIEESIYSIEKKDNKFVAELYEFPTITLHTFDDFSYVLSLKTFKFGHKDFSKDWKSFISSKLQEVAPEVVISYTSECSSKEDCSQM